MRPSTAAVPWPPQAFWHATVWELTHAWEGYARSKGIKTEGDFMTRDELDELKQRFPDR